jgi:hypothetical protein
MMARATHAGACRAACRRTTCHSTRGAVRCTARRTARRTTRHRPRQTGRDDHHDPVAPRPSWPGRVLRAPIRASIRATSATTQHGTLDRARRVDRPAHLWTAGAGAERCAGSAVLGSRFSSSPSQSSSQSVSKSHCQSDAKSNAKSKLWSGSYPRSRCRALRDGCQKCDPGRIDDMSRDALSELAGPAGPAGLAELAGLAADGGPPPIDDGERSKPGRRCVRGHPATVHRGATLDHVAPRGTAIGRRCVNRRDGCTRQPDQGS